MSDLMMLMRGNEKNDNSLFPGVLMSKIEIYVVLGNILFSLFD